MKIVKYPIFLPFYSKKSEKIMLVKTNHGIISNGY